MGQQSIKEKTRMTMLDSVNTTLLDMAYQQYIKDHFLVGNHVDKERLKHNTLLKYTLCTNNCDVIEDVWNQIKNNK